MYRLVYPIMFNVWFVKTTHECRKNKYNSRTLFCKFKLISFFKKKIRQLDQQSRYKNLKTLSSNITKNTPLDYFVTPNQSAVLFLKRKFGMYKSVKFSDKRLKNKLFFLVNYIRNKKLFKLRRHKRTPRIIFSKRLKKLFFRAGRRIIVAQLAIKKYMTQKNITRCLQSRLKKPWVPLLFGDVVKHVLVKTSLFFTIKDSAKFIATFGVLVNEKRHYNPDLQIKANDFFSSIFSRHLFKFIRRKRKKILQNLKKIKFYKFRSKLFYTKFRFNWVPTSFWLAEHSFLYTNKFNNIEFDIKTLSGCYLYSFDYINHANSINIQQLSLYMIRSYTWKYIT